MFGGNPAVLEISSDARNVSESTNLLIESSTDDEEVSHATKMNCDSKTNTAVSVLNVGKFVLYAEDENSCDDLTVIADNPQKHVEPFETYISYRITTSTRRPEYCEHSYLIRRRYSDFIWLRNKLLEDYKTRIIPPLPGKHALVGQLDKFSKDFIAFRLIMLHRFLNRIAKHPILTYSPHLKCFLTANSTEFMSYKKQHGYSLLSVSSITSITNFMHASSKDRISEFDDVSKYADKLSDKLGRLEKIMLRIHKERKELSKEMVQLSAEFSAWMDCEDNLAPTLEIMSTALYHSSANMDETFLNGSMEAVIFQPIREYLLYLDCVKEALNRREAVQLQFDQSVKDVYKKKMERDQQVSKKGGDESNEEKFQSSENAKPKLTSLVEANEDKLEIANEDLRADLERWNMEKKEDFKRILLAMADRYIQYYKKNYETWDKTSKVLNSTWNFNRE